MLKSKMYGGNFPKLTISKLPFEQNVSQTT